MGNVSVVYRLGIISELLWHMKKQQNAHMRS